jgi:hypothetical protein
MAPRRRHNAPTNSPFNAGSKGGKISNTSSVAPTPTTETPPKDLTTREPITVDTNVTSAIPNPAQFNQLSPSVRDVAEHAAVLKSVLSRLGPIYDLVEREASRMAEVSPLLAGKDQVDEARNRLAADAEKREEKVRAIKNMIEAEKRKIVATINQQLEDMIKNVVATKVKERVKAKVEELVEPYRKVLLGSKGRALRNQMFLDNIETRNKNATIRSRFPREPITPIHRPINVEFQIQRSPTASPRVGPVGGYHPSPPPKFPESFGALINLSLADSTMLLKEYCLEPGVNDRKVPEEVRLDNLNKLMSYFGIGYRLHPGPARKAPIITSLWDRR